MRKYGPWYYVILGGIRDEEVISLQDIYEIVEDGQDESKSLFDPALSQPDPKRGNRPRYQHTVQAICCQLVNEGLAERISRGYYRITDRGRQFLREYEG